MQTKAASIDFSFSRFSYRLQSELSPSLSRELGPAFMEERTVVRAGSEVGIEFDQPISIVDAHDELMQDVEAEHLADRRCGGRCRRRGRRRGRGRRARAAAATGRRNQCDSRENGSHGKPALLHRSSLAIWVRRSPASPSLGPLGPVTSERTSTP